MTRHDSNMLPGRLHLEPKRPYFPGDDHTSTMWEKKRLMDAGVQLRGPINYTPQHRRSARGIMAGVVIGIGVWALLGGIGLMVFRIFN